MFWHRRAIERALHRQRQEIVSNISKSVKAIEATRKEEGRTLGQRDVEAMKAVGRNIAKGNL